MLRSPAAFSALLLPSLAPAIHAQCELQELVDAAPEDTAFFGAALDADGLWIVVGSAFDDELGENSGSATVFRRVGTGWVHVTKLTPSDGGECDYFGQSVALAGDHLLVGAPGGYPCGDHEGAVYVFENTGAGWVEVAKLGASDPADRKEFGYRIVVDGDRAVIGAAGQLGPDAGPESAYVFERTALGWKEVEKLVALDGFLGDSFASSVALSGDTIVVGAPNDNDAGQLTGSATVFEHDGGAWNDTQVLTASDAEWNEHFGSSVALFGDTALIGCAADDNYRGAVYVFERIAGVWQETAKLVAAHSKVNDLFGSSVALHGNTALIGARGFQDDRGAVYFFERTVNGWVNRDRILASDGVAGDELGRAAVLWSSTTGVVGAPSKSDIVIRAGSAYVLRVAIGERYCSSTTNSSGAAADLSAVGDCFAASNDLALEAAFLPPHQPGYFLIGTESGFVANPGGSQGDLCLGGAVARLNHQVQDSGPDGELAVQIDLAAPPPPLSAAQAGTTWTFQAWFRDRNPGPTSNFTDAVAVTFL